MKVKKNPELNPEKTKMVYFQLGLLVTSACTLMAFSWRSPLNEHIRVKEERIAEVPTLMVEKIEEPVVQPVVIQQNKTDQAPSNPIITEELETKKSTDINPELGVVTAPLNHIKIGDFDVPIGPAPELESVVKFPDKEASFNGSWSNYLASNIVYPEEAKIFQEAGNVWVEFIVEKDGSITDVKANPNSHKSKDLRNEAIRVVKNSPKWNPATLNGEYVRTYARVKIRFHLE